MTMNERAKLIVVIGPTAAGKSALALRLAKELDGEIVSADSVQVYRRFDIGTGKLPLAEREQIPHHLIDIVDPTVNFSAARFIEEATSVINEIHQRKKQVIIAGGTGLYVKALLYGLFAAPLADEQIRQAHRQEAKEQGVQALHARLAQIDPQAAARIDPHDLVRISRALEVYEQTGQTITSMQSQHGFKQRQYPALLIGVAPARETLRQLIETRVDQMMAAGWLDEVRQLIADGYGQTQPMGSLGYRQLYAHLHGGLDLNEAVRQTKRDTWRFAKRQLNWFSSEKNVQWCASSSEVVMEEIAAQIAALV